MNEFCSSLLINNSPDFRPGCLLIYYLSWHRSGQAKAPVVVSRQDIHAVQTVSPFLAIHPSLPGNVNIFWMMDLILVPSYGQNTGNSGLRTSISGQTTCNFQKAFLVS
jgi:hypothetical protein